MNFHRQKSSTNVRKIPNVTENALQVEELKLKKMKLSMINDFDEFYIECLNLLNDNKYDNYYKLMSLSLLLRDKLPYFSIQRKSQKNQSNDKQSLQSDEMI